jgi:hypothetical protein
MMDFAVDTGYEDTHAAASDAMTGPATAANQAASAGAGKGTATRGLIMLWLGALAAYWAFGYLFRRQLS